jgi:hypothetical protein
MPTVLKPKKSETADAVPTTSDLAVGEICINVADQKIYTRKSDDSIVVVSSVTSGGGSLTANSVNGTHIALGSDATGDIMYYNGTDYIRLAKGSNGEVLTLASGVPSWAADSTNVSGTSMGGDLGGTVGNATISANAIDGTHIALGSDAAGDVMYYDGTNYIRLAKGTAEQVLTMNSGATAPSWVTVAGGAGNAVGISFISPTVDADITFSAGENGKSDGPLAITVGIAVTISAGSTWTIRD